MREREGEMGDLSYTELTYQVDEFYFCALSFEEEVFPICDEKYAEQLQFQEVLVSAVVACPRTISQPQRRVFPVPQRRRVIKERGESSSSSSSSSSARVFCKICMEASPRSEMFINSNCTHVFCRDCLSQYIGAKVRENISMLKCPEVDCEGVLEPEFCQDIIPKEVFERWESALCEAMIVGTNKFYCPFKDCSALMLDDGDGAVMQAECPSCRRLFCAKCLVAWHSGLSCDEFGKLGDGERGRLDLLLMELAKNKNWKRCPRCKFYVEKTAGCQHVTCRCRFEFCYGCQREWIKNCSGCSGES